MAYLLKRSTAISCVLALMLTGPLTDLSAADISPKARPADKLAPVVRHNPIVTIERTSSGEYRIVEDEKEKGYFLEGFKEDAAFIYFSLLAGQALELGLSEAKLRELIGRDLSHLELGGFLPEYLYRDGDTFCLPYVRKDADELPEERRGQLLRFYLENDSRPEFPDQVLIRSGNVRVVLEDPVIPLPGRTGDGTSSSAVPDPGLPAAFPDFGNPSGDLPVRLDITGVERLGTVMFPDREKEQFVLNAGVLDIDNKRLLFARRATKEIVTGEKAGDSGIKRSEIGLFLHDPGNGDVVEIDREMILPDGEEIVALEDARVIERDGTVYVYLTAVRSDRSYYSAVVTHPAASFVEKVNEKLSSPGTDVEWDWSAPEQLMTSGRYSEMDNKNFVPFANPSVIDGREYWFALYRPAEKGNSTMRLAVSAEGLGGPWRDAGQYMDMDPDRGWLGASAYVAEMPAGKGHRWDFMLYHKATYRDPQQKTSKYYDIRILVTDRNAPGRYYATEPILMPEQGYELQGWVPGAIYSCGAILTDHDPETGEYKFDVYYSGSDTAVLLANIGIKLADDAPAADAREKTPLRDPVETSREEFGNIADRFRTVEELFDSGDLTEMKGHVIALGRMVDDWDVIGGEGFGVSEEAGRLVDELSHIKDIISRYQANGYETGDALPIRRQLGGAMNASRIYMDAIQRKIASPLGPREAARFFKPLPYKTLPDLQSELLEITKTFEELDKERSGAYRVERREDGRIVTPWTEGFSFSSMEESASSLLQSVKLWRLQWRRNRISMENDPRSIVRDISGEARRVIRVLERIRDICRGEPAEYEGDVRSVQKKYYTLNEPLARGKASLRAIDRGFERLCRAVPPEDGKGEAAVSVNRRGIRSAEALVDGLRLAAFRAAEKNEKIILGLDWSWIPGLGDRQSDQRMAIQGLLAEILRLRRKGQLNNVIIVSGRGEDLAAEIADRTAETSTPMSNIVVLGKSRDVVDGHFDRLISDDPAQSAFIVGVDPANITDNSFIDVAGIIKAAVDLAFGEKDRVDTPGIRTKSLRDRIWIFMPEAEPYDLDQLKRFYESQRQALVAA